MNKFKHYCPDWDFMLIDSHNSEFECCTCDFSDIPIAIEVLDDLMGYSGVGTDGNPYDTPSWNAALRAAKDVIKQRIINNNDLTQ